MIELSYLVGPKLPALQRAPPSRPRPLGPTPTEQAPPSRQQAPRSRQAGPALLQQAPPLRRCLPGLPHSRHGAERCPGTHTSAAAATAGAPALGWGLPVLRRCALPTDPPSPRLRGQHSLCPSVWYSRPKEKSRRSQQLEPPEPSSFPIPFRVDGNCGRRGWAVSPAAA